ncbi:MAG: hypothetical protein M5R40_24115 [Anaerolineae bacterium]|nr:hypothetical protein [Anaerolineae bacterium]
MTLKRTSTRPATCAPCAGSVIATDSGRATSTGTVASAWLPAASAAMTVRVCAPSAAASESHVKTPSASPDSA